MLACFVYRFCRDSTLTSAFLVGLENPSNECYCSLFSSVLAVLGNATPLDSFRKSVFHNIRLFHIDFTVVRSVKSKLNTDDQRSGRTARNTAGKCPSRISWSFSAYLGLKGQKQAYSSAAMQLSSLPLIVRNAAASRSEPRHTYPSR